MRRKERFGDKKLNRSLEGPEQAYSSLVDREKGVGVTSLRKGQVRGLKAGPSLRLYKHNHQLDLTAICRALQTSTVENLFSNAHTSLTETDQILGHKINHDEVKRTKIIHNMCQIIIELN